MTTPRRRITAGEAANFAEQAARVAGQVIREEIRRERKRTATLFVITWAAIVVTFVVAVVR